MTGSIARPALESRALKLLADCEAQVAALDPALSMPGRTVLRAMISSYADVTGGPSVRVVASLYTLTGDLLNSGRFDRQAIAVHMRAWRLTLTGDVDGHTQATLMEGLKSVRDLYANAKAA